MTWHPLPSPGSGRIPFPCFVGTMECSDFLPPFPPHSVSFARRYHVVRLNFAPAGSRRRTRRPGVGNPVAPIRTVRVETVGRPRFLKNPCVPMPCSTTPAGPTRQAIRRRRRGPRYSPRRRLPRQKFFRGSITRPWHSLSTLRGLGYPSTARKTRFPLLATLRGRDWLPAGFQRKVSVLLLTSRPPFSSFPGARAANFFSILAPPAPPRPARFFR